jgi:8-oxo-dGTP pyrophosphatase MutT (NUDIX family)
MDRNWKVLESIPVFSSPFITVYKDKLQKPDGAIVADYYSVKRSDAVFIVPLTKDKKVLLVNQFKNGVKDLVWELPAGFIEAKEEPVEAARRELLEETGYKEEEIISLGSFVPNLGISSNKNYLFIAKNIKKVAEQKLDQNEDIEFEFFDFEKLIKDVRERKTFLLDTQSQLGLLLTAEEIK